MKYLLDTNVVSELVAKSPNSGVLDWLDAQDADSIYLSVITLGELAKGIERLPESKRKHSLQTWLMQDLIERFDGHILDVDTAVMLRWGQVTAQAEQRGRQLPAIDSILAAIALVHSCHLVTRNESDFDGTGVTIVNPWAQP